MSNVFAISIVVLLLGMSASAMTNTEDRDNLLDENNARNSHSGLNYPGSAPGSIYSASTILASWNYTCVVLENNGMKCWGNGGWGRLGNGESVNRADPVSVLLANDGGSALAKEVGTGLSHHTCALMMDSNIKCWGEGYYGQVGDGWNWPWNTEPYSVIMPTGRTAKTVANGGHHSCAIMDDYSVWCWGQNYEGQLGNGGNDDANTPVQSGLPTGMHAISIATGWDSTCVILNDSSGVCAGWNEDGQLGDGTQINQTTFNQISVLPPNSELASISVSSSFTCGLLKNGSIYCWGSNEDGQHGDGTTTSKPSSSGQVQLPQGRTAITVDVGLKHACAVLDDDSAVCWGDNEYGQIGDNTTTNRTTPTNVTFPGGIGVSSISAGRVHTCAIVTNGSVYCWGAHEQGSLGNGWDTDSDIPLYVDLLEPAGIHVALGERDHDDDGILNIFDDYPFPPPTCPAGQYLVDYECVETSPGYYTPNEGMTEQIPCPMGTYQPNSGQDSCIDTSPGYYTDSNASSSMTKCLAGTFQNQTGQTGCIDAPAGHYTVDDGSVNPILCTAGTYQPNSGQTSCIASDAGNYVPLEGQTNQTPCEPGKYQPGFGRSLCYETDPGHHTSQAGSITQEECLSGTYADDFGLADCKDASPGNYVDSSAAISQTPCSSGEYQPYWGQSSCLLADAGNYVYQTGQSSQTPCAIGTYQADTGQTSCDDASAGNYVDQTGQSSQTPCAIGTYQAYTGQTSCDDASAGNYVLETGQSSQRFCAIGTYQADTGQTSCDDASAGNYVDQTGQSSQIACLAGTYNPDTGSTSSSACIDASPGSHVPLPAQASQTVCDAGTYQSESGSAECTPTIAGYYSAEGSTAPSGCTEGTFQPEPQQGSCLDAEPGNYVSHNIATQQTPCEIGSYQSLAGQTSCETADRGNYVDSEGADHQTPCAAGSYQPLIGSSECKLASFDYFVVNTGSTTQEKCPSGESQPLIGQTSCIKDADEGGLPIAVIGGAVVLLVVVGALMMQRSKPKPKKRQRSSKPMKKRRPRPVKEEE